MKKKVASDEAVREALESLYKGTLIEEAMDLTLRLMREKDHRKRLASFLISRLNQDFLRINSHVPALGKQGDRNNEQAVCTWANRKFDKNPEQLEEITSEFMVNTYYELQEILIENRYL